MADSRDALGLEHAANTYTPHVEVPSWRYTDRHLSVVDGIPRTADGHRAMRRNFTSIDGYLKGVPDDRRRALKDLRKTILSVIPEAQECISYRMPAFRVNGVVVAGFAATTKGCSYFPFSGSTLKTLRDVLSRYEQTKSSLHFSPGDRLPMTLVRKLIKTRMAETKNKAISNHDRAKDKA